MPAGAKEAEDAVDAATARAPAWGDPGARRGCASLKTTTTQHNTGSAEVDEMSRHIHGATTVAWAGKWVPRMQRVRRSKRTHACWHACRGRVRWGVHAQGQQGLQPLHSPHAAQGSDHGPWNGDGPPSGILCHDVSCSLLGGHRLHLLQHLVDVVLAGAAAIPVMRGARCSAHEREGESTDYSCSFTYSPSGAVTSPSAKYLSVKSNPPVREGKVSSPHASGGAGRKDGDRRKDLSPSTGTRTRNT